MALFSDNPMKQGEAADLLKENQATKEAQQQEKEVQEAAEAAVRDAAKKAQEAADAAEAEEALVTEKDLGFLKNE